MNQVPTNVDAWVEAWTTVYIPYISAGLVCGLVQMPRLVFIIADVSLAITVKSFKKVSVSSPSDGRAAKGVRLAGIGSSGRLVRTMNKKRQTRAHFLRCKKPVKIANKGKIILMLYEYIPRSC